MPHTFLNVRALAIKWKTFHVIVLSKMVIGDTSIIPGMCK
jgi:hypothetical protein